MATVSDKSLDQLVTDDDVQKLADLIVSWEGLRAPFGLTRAQQREIESVGRYGKQKVEFVEEWREKAGNTATYGTFIKVAREQKQNKLADSVVTILRDREVEGGFHVLVLPWGYKRTAFAYAGGRI